MMKVDRAVLLQTLLFIGVLTAPAQGPVPDGKTITESELVRRTQELYDSLPSGDRSQWEQYYADDVMVHDEKGRSMNKKAFLADIEPMPAGYSGTIKVVHPHTIFAPAVAILAYKCEETETIFGQDCMPAITQLIHGCSAAECGKLRQVKRCATTKTCAGHYRPRRSPRLRRHVRVDAGQAAHRIARQQ